MSHVVGSLIQEHTRVHFYDQGEGVDGYCENISSLVQDWPELLHWHENYTMKESNLLLLRHVKEDHISIEFWKQPLLYFKAFKFHSTFHYALHIRFHHK